MICEAKREKLARIAREICVDYKRLKHTSANKDCFPIVVYEIVTFAFTLAFKTEVYVDIKRMYRLSAVQLVNIQITPY